MLPESGLLIAVSWRPALLPELEPINVQQRGSAAANACFRLLKNQPQRHHLWPLCWNSQDTPPHPILLSSPPHQPFLSHSPSAFTSVQPWECFHPSLLQATCAQYNLHHEPYETPSAHSPISCHSLPPPTTFIVFLSLSDTVSSLPCRVCDRRKGLKCASGGFSDVRPTDGAGWRCS